MKTQLTAEESAKLIELGVSPERASERTFDLKDVNNLSKPLERRELLPIFTLADILDILPKEIRHNGCTYKLNIDYPPIGMVAARYNTEWDDLDSIKGYMCEELIDALYSLLVWCLEKGYVKLN
ncbi:hypothetical protein [uncultured Muribaculum sp.]|uniref:hypothetical protein n=1 Tax=uncultured Muribaculum sp. TaxID=1918613 RepID=UPI0027301971|nr:hypothetical protein [uncultured Muribaculum sp.]